MSPMPFAIKKATYFRAEHPDEQNRHYFSPQYILGENGVPNPNSPT